MKKLLKIFLAVMLNCGLGYGATIVGSFDWNDGTLQGWSTDQSWSHLSSPGSGGVDDSGFLKIDMDATSSFPPDGWYTLASAPASSLFAGTWRSDMWVQFDFWAQDVEPAYVQVRWAGQDGTVWQNTVFDSADSSMTVGDWTRLSSADFSNYANWDYGGGSQEDFVNDLASIDWIGVYIWRNTGAAQGYGIDDFNLMVPEPEEYIMLMASLLCVVLAVRYKRSCAEL